MTTESREAAATIAGVPAAWLHLDLEVETDTAKGPRRIDADPVELYGLLQPEESIDAAALLREREIADPPYWALVWTGAMAIAAYLSTERPSPGSRVLDLGCGLGLSGLAAARLGAAVTFGDYLPEPLAFVRASLERSAFEGCTVETIDFTGDEDHGRFDLILAADIVYDPAHYDPLAAFLDRSLEAEGTILLTESLRADASRFLDGLTARGFRDEKTALWVREEGRRERTWLHRIRRVTDD